MHLYHYNIHSVIIISANIVVFQDVVISSCVWILLQGVMIFNWIQYKPLKYGEHYSYPPLANAIGWLMALAPIIFILSMAIYKVCQAPGNMSLLEVSPASTQHNLVEAHCS